MFRHISIICLFAITITGCKKEYVTPSLRTANVHSITSSSARSGGEITDNGGVEITAKGICWSTTEKPTIADNFTVDGAGSGSYTSTLEGLASGVTYHVRAYATNRVGTDYGNEVTFNTLTVPPSLTTAEITAITASTATSGGNIIADGGSPVTARGVCWGTTENPTVDNNKTENGTGTGTFVSNLINLTGATTYYVRAYATNSQGTAYGNQVTFTTSAVVAPTLTTTEVSGLTSTSAISGGSITNTGGGVITANGVCWSTSENPTIAGSFTSDATGSATFVSNITGLTDGTIYYVRAYATNSSGTSYGNQLTIITPVTDIEGNIYKTVLIGSQVWMAENLKTVTFNDNTGIQNVTGNASWVSTTTPAYSWYNNDIANKDISGALYNWHTVNTGKLCPQGWHVPADADYNTLEMYLGISATDVHIYGFRGTDQGTQLKSTSTWTENGNGTNSSGFTALGAGYRQWITGEFYGSGTFTYFWTSTDDAINGHPEVAWYRRLDSTDPRIYKGTTIKVGGKYIRCVKD
jgi:uncharacterized protein (TIGR02145 family)